MRRLSLRWKVLIPVVAAIIVLAGIIFLVSQHLIYEQAEQMALTKVRSDLALMFELLEEKLPGPGVKAHFFIKETISSTVILP